MKILVTGGRDFTDYKLIDAVLSEYKDYIELVIHGGASGADLLANAWCLRNYKPVLQHPANWPRLGKRAGHVRNAAMLKWKPDLVIAFPGGKGTANMVSIAEENGVPVRRVKQMIRASHTARPFLTPAEQAQEAADRQTAAKRYADAKKAARVLSGRSSDPESDPLNNNLNQRRYTKGKSRGNQ